MERIREDFNHYLYQTCLKATITENRPLRLDERQKINNCYVRMATAFKEITDLHNSTLQAPHPSRNIF